MDRFRPLAWPAYLTFALLIVFPLVDALLTVWPLRPGEVSWRFGAVGIFSRALMTPLFGLLLVFALALALEHRAMQRLVAALSGSAGLAMVAASGFFVLDAVQMRSQVQRELVAAFDTASVVALIKIVVIAAIAFLLAVAAWRAGRQAGRAAARPDQPLIVAPGARAESTAGS